LLSKWIGTPLEIKEATTPEDFRAAGDMMLGFLAWNRQRLNGDWPNEAFELHDRIREDVVGLENRNLREGWRIYLARIGSELAGCAVLKPIDPMSCELKRLFVVRHLQRLRVGSAICEHIFTAAKQLGFNLIKLDTADVQVEALSLFEQLGFARCEPYKQYPPQILSRVVFMQRDL